MEQQQYLELTGWIGAQLEGEKRPLLVAIDGRCGSGKTSLAAALAEQFPQSLTVHMDDFYLPMEQRVPDWENRPCANMDLLRFRDQVLKPARAGQTIEYRAFSCAQKREKEPVLLPPRPLVLVEGSYSHHPLLAPFYDVRVFLTCRPEVQARRLLAREGERYPMFARRWIPLEEGYFAEYAIPEKADRVLDNS